MVKFGLLATVKILANLSVVAITLITSQVTDLDHKKYGQHLGGWE